MRSESNSLTKLNRVVKYFKQYTDQLQQDIIKHKPDWLPFETAAEQAKRFTARMNEEPPTAYFSEMQKVQEYGRQMSDMII